MGEVRDEATETLLDEAEASIDRGDPETALRLCTQALEISPGHPGAHFVRGDALRVLGRLEDAADSYRNAALARPDHASSWASLALTSFELLDIQEARRCAARATREDPMNPEGWWVRSLILEWLGLEAAAKRSLFHARWLDPVSYPLPPELHEDELIAILTDAMSYLPESIRQYLHNVPVVLEERPTEAILRYYDPPASPVELYGYFSGYSLMERSAHDAWSQLPPTIVLFRRNIARRAANRDELVEQLRITFFHEVGHFLGFDEDDLESRGLD